MVQVKCWRRAPKLLRIQVPFTNFKKMPLLYYKPSAMSWHLTNTDIQRVAQCSLGVITPVSYETPLAAIQISFLLIENPTPTEGSLRMQFAKLMEHCPSGVIARGL
jgi:hypothetical protein